MTHRYGASQLIVKDTKRGRGYERGCSIMDPKSCITAAKRSDTHCITSNLDPIETPDYWAPIAPLPKDGE
jgi:hypothetical protein